MSCTPTSNKYSYIFLFLGKAFKCNIVIFILPFNAHNAEKMFLFLTNPFKQMTTFHTDLINNNMMLISTATLSQVNGPRDIIKRFKVRNFYLTSYFKSIFIYS